MPVKISPFEGFIQAVNGQRIGPGGDNQIRVGSGVKDCLDFGQHIFPPDNLFPFHRPATFGEDLIFDE
jgi:hypothetical protein